MKPKFDIPLQASRAEIDALIRLYAERLYRNHSSEETPIAEWKRWNADRLSELVALLDEPR